MQWMEHILNHLLGLSMLWRIWGMTFIILRKIIKKLDRPYFLSKISFIVARSSNISTGPIKISIFQHVYWFLRNKKILSLLWQKPDWNQDQNIIWLELIRLIHLENSFNRNLEIYPFLWQVILMTHQIVNQFH